MKDNKESIEKKGVEKSSHKVEKKSFEGFFKNRLRVPTAILEELERKGMDHRWINYSDYIKNGYFHKSHWEPYKPAGNVDDKQFGKDVNGYIRRGDLILGIRSKEVTAAHKEFLANKNRIYKNYAKTAANKLRSDLRGKGKVYEGYDDNEKKEF